MHLIKQITFHKQDNDHDFPFHLGFFNKTMQLGDVTLIVGDNGSGKSTLLELLSHELKLYQIGKPLIIPKPIKISLKYHLTKPLGFYFSAEDFTSYIHRLQTDKSEAKKALKEIDATYQNKSVFAKNQARAAHSKTIYEIDQLYDKDLLTSSHGESYLSFFKSRIKPNQLFILDEPETPLSFDNQLALIYMIHEGVKQGAQFIISTHSPILCAYPNAKIYEITKDDIHLTSYDQLDSINLLKQFINDPNRFYNHLFKS
jgi:predicted ATPase